jgi:uncharacterized membrane protein YphA (DoxX/SURF4 family)
MSDAWTLRIARTALRVALGTAFLSAVADRFGLWGPPGAAHVAWGDWSHFVAYAARLNWFLPRVLISPVAWIATIAEIVLGAALLIGIRGRLVAWASAALLTLFGCAMAVALGIKAPLDFSVFTAAAGALLLGAVSKGKGKGR